MSVFKDSIDTFLVPVKKYLEDPTVSEILVNGHETIFVEQKGLLRKTSARFNDEQALEAAVRNIAQFVGRRIDDENPTLDARLPDGSRIHAVLPPCSRQGVVLSIRKFDAKVPSLADLITRGTISKEAARFLDCCVFLGKNIIISGGTGSGKTTFLNVLGARVPSNQRLLIIEDASELKIKTDHVVYFETKPADAEGKGAVSIRDLIRSALRLRPDRIVVGEVRGPEALDLITGMNTGHSGSMGTTHANTPYDALVRLETLSLMGDTQVPVMAIRRQISAAIHLVVQIERYSDGTRKVSCIAEVLIDTDEAGRYQIRNIFEFVQKGRSKEGVILGELVATGYLPTFIADFVTNGLPFTADKLTAPDWYLEWVKKTRRASGKAA